MKPLGTEENLQRMKEGRLYFPGEDSIVSEQNALLERQYECNHLPPSQAEKRIALLKELFAEFGEGSYIEPPFFANWGGKNVHLGKGVYINFNCVFSDDGEIFVGDYCMFGPQVTVATPGHPILPELRGDNPMQYNLPVHIGNNVWVGAGSIILPGVTIGDNSVIGAGSVVNRDIPANVVAVGNPCRVLRPIGERDRAYYWGNLPIDVQDVEL